VPAAVSARLFGHGADVGYFSLGTTALLGRGFVWACQDVACMTSANVAPPFLSSRARTAAVLLPGRTPSAFGLVAFWGALAAFFARVVFWVDWGLEGATRRACLADAGFVVAFGAGFSPRFRISAACVQGSPLPPM